MSKKRKPRIDIGDTWTLELERDYIQLAGERIAVALQKQIVNDNTLSEGEFDEDARKVRLLTHYPTLDALGTGFWEESLHGICNMLKIEIPHDTQVLLAHCIWLASGTLHPTNWED